MYALPFTLPRHWQPALHFIREAVTLRTALVAAAFLAVVSVALVAVNVSNAALSCRAGESLLVYPVYSNRGVVIDSVQRCGASHRGCTARANASGVYDCSPFMAPKGTLSIAR